MTLIDPRDALGEQSSFIGYLLGLASLGHIVRSLADPDDHNENICAADDFDYLLLGIAGLGSVVERLVEQTPTPQPPPPLRPESTTARWLR